MHARVALGVGKCVLFREVSSVQECPHREIERFHSNFSTLAYSQAEESMPHKDSVNSLHIYKLAPVVTHPTQLLP